MGKAGINNHLYTREWQCFIQRLLLPTIKHQETALDLANRRFKSIYKMEQSHRIYSLQPYIGIVSPSIQFSLNCSLKFFTLSEALKHSEVPSCPRPASHLCIHRDCCPFRKGTCKV